MDCTKRRDFLKLAFASGAGALVSLQNPTQASAATSQKLEKKPVSWSPFPRKAEGVSERIKGNILLLTRQERSLELNPVGSFIWLHINGARSNHHLAQLVSEEYNIDFSSSLKDCQKFVSSLSDESFLVLSGSKPCYQYPI
ncbi:MAG: PqqD family peptide modification chaperone [Desulfobulbaceae bacterium]|nr:PqqD family peptide modification chaperone [Desulfobulbaceae bacterium]